MDNEISSNEEQQDSDLIPAPSRPSSLDSIILPDRLPETFEELSALLLASNFRGEFRAVHKVRRALNTHITALRMQQLEQIKDNHLWRAWGYESFAAYLDSPEVEEFNSTKYYEERLRLKKLGDEPFEAFNYLGTPKKTVQKLIDHKIKIEVDGHDLVINGDRASMNDPKQVDRLLGSLVDQLDLQDHREQKLKKEIEAKAKTIAQKDKQIERINYDREVEILGDPINRSLAILQVAFSQVEIEIEKMPLPAEQSDQLRDIFLEVIQRHINGVRKAFRTQKLSYNPDDPPDTLRPRDGESFGDFSDRVGKNNFEDFLSQIENDKDLANQLKSERIRPDYKLPSH